MRRRRIHIDNHTHYSTPHIRAFITRAAAMLLDPEQKPRIFVRVDYTRGGHGYSTGCAFLNGNSMTIRLAHDPHGVDKVDFAFVIAHELGHLLGMTHGQMRGAALFNRVNGYRERYGWAESLPLEVVKLKAAPRVTGAPLAEKKLAQIDAKLSEWKAKRKRAEAAIKKYARKRAYYARRLQAMTPQPQEPQ